MRIHDPLQAEADELLRLIEAMPAACRPVGATEPLLMRAPPPIQFSSQRELDQTYKLINEYSLRMKEALMLYRPLPVAARFHASKTARRIVIGSNRAGKTLQCAVECARVVTGQDPYNKSLATNGKFVAVGQDEDHIGQVMWRKLAMPGAFQIIQDLDTGAWRAVRPDPKNPLQLDPSDEARRKLWRPAPPLLPPRLMPIKHVSWFKKKENIPKQVPLATGWELRFRSGNAAPDQGTADDFAWFDEEIRNELYYIEIAARLIDQGGLLVWSATGQSATDQLLAIHDMASDGEEGFELFEVLIDDNPYLDAAKKRQFYSDCMAIGQDELDVRYYGKLAAHALKVYPEFQPLTVHTCDDFDIPVEWTRYMIVDPGFQVCAVLFAAVPTDESQVHIYHEIRIAGSTPDMFADAVQAHMNSERVRFEAFIIDDRGSRARIANTGKTIGEAYWHALQERNLRARRTGFVPGSDDVNGRTAELKRWMQVDPNTGNPKLQIHRGRCPHLVEELKKQFFHKKGVDKRKDKKGHFTDDLEYLAAFRPYYRKPELMPESGYYLRPKDGKYEIVVRGSGFCVERFDRLDMATEYLDEMNDNQKAAVISLKQRKQWSERRKELAPMLASVFGDNR